MEITNTKVVAVFAHPDDEAFGPSGTLAKLAQTNEVYLLCATKGEAGKNYTKSRENISRIREKELLKSAQILGIKKVYFLGFIDGTLSNNLYHKLAAKIEKKLREIKPTVLLTYEPRGVSGHIDHITVSMVTSYVFHKLPFVKTLLYHCMPEEVRKLIKDYFIYFPPGYKKSEINRVVDVGEYWPKKIEAIMAHSSQCKDIETIISMLQKRPKKEFFLEVRKP